MQGINSRNTDNFELVLRTFRKNQINNNEIIFVGFFRNDNECGAKVRAFIDEKEIPVEITINEGLDIRRKYLDYGANVSQEIIGKIVLPNDWAKSNKLLVYTELNDLQKKIFSLSGDEMEEFYHSIQGNVDWIAIQDDEKIHISGWTAATDGAEFYVFNGKQEIPVEVIRRYRKDAISDFPEVDPNSEFGFEVVCDNCQYDELNFVIKNGDNVFEKNFNINNIGRDKSVVTSNNVLKRVVRYCAKYGVRSTLKKIIHKVFDAREAKNNSGFEGYMDYFEKISPDEKELQKQKDTVFEYSPKISIVIPLYKTPDDFLKELLDSIMNQTYSNWQLCLADGSEDNSLGEKIKSYTNGDSRIVYRHLDSNDGISENTNRAIKISDGEFVAFSDHDDILTVDALYEVINALNQDSEIDCVYSDEDKMDMDGKTLYMPHFKSDFNIDLLCSHNYITHLYVLRKSILDEVGMLRSDFDGSQDHDMIFRSVERARKVYHIPRVLYHWRCHKNSTAMNPESKMYCYEAGRKSVQSHFDRLGIPAKVTMAPNYGYYRTEYFWKGSPLVSIIIPNKDHVEDLKKCLTSILEKSLYKNYEIIVVENKSTTTEIFDYYKKIEKIENIRVIKYDGDFNYSKINNFGVEKARGEFLLFLNNDTELIEKNSIKEMLDICRRNDVGAVGARLYYKDNTVQHSGVILNVGGVANHAFTGIDRGDVGYFFRSVCVQDLSAVTAACMMTSRECFDCVKGFSENLAVAFNDIDYCLKLKKNNKLIVFTPFSEWYHYESKSRGYDSTPEKIERLKRETEIFKILWPDVLSKVDPYYNPNLNMDRADFTLRKI
jgi:GT2 family glycosyltransferase